jgi:hypothetical protein
LALYGWYRHGQVITLILAFAAVPGAGAQVPAEQAPSLKIVEISERDGQILSYRHLAGSTEVHMRGTRLAPDAQITLKIGSRPGFVELDINRGGIRGLQAAQLLGKDFLTYVLWAVSVDGKASNLGEITFQGGRPVPVNVTTPYQTFWLMVTAEPHYAVVAPSTKVVLFSVRHAASGDSAPLPIKGDLFFFTHYPAYDATPGGAVDGTPNPLLQARKAVELASRSGVLAGSADGKRNARSKEEVYSRVAQAQATAFLERAEVAYKKNPADQTVVQFARTAAQIAENARALAMGAVGGLLVRQLESELAAVRGELLKLRTLPPVVTESSPAATTVDPPERVHVAPPHPPPVATAAPPLVKQPALWFAAAGWAVAVVLLFRRRSI